MSTVDKENAYRTLGPHVKKRDVAGLAAALRQVVDAGLEDEEAADMVAHQTAELLLDLGNSGKIASGLAVVERYLELSSAIPASPKRKQYFAAFALGALKKRPELAAKIEAELLQDPIVDSYYGVRVARGLAGLGLIDQALRVTAGAMAAGATKKAVLAEAGLKKLYAKVPRFKALVDGAEELAASFDEEPEPDDLEQVLAAAKAELTRPGHEGRPSRIRAVLRFTKHRSEVEAFFAEGFEVLKQTAAKRDKLVSHTLFDALARTIAAWGRPALASLLVREIEYVSGDEPHYELNQVAGTLALSLAALGYKGRVGAIDAFVASYEWRYKGEDFVMQARYAKWMIARDGKGAVAFVRDDANAKGFAYAACALADLHHQTGRVALEKLLPDLANQVTAEAVKEAIARLRRQKKAPPWPDRMIRLFGETTRTEIALGAETDNQFVLRARHATRSL